MNQTGTVSVGRGRLLPAALMAAALVWVTVSVTGAPWPAQDADLKGWLVERRIWTLGPPLACLGLIALLARDHRSCRLALAFALFGVSWGTWGVVARLLHDGGSAWHCVSAAGHERVLLPSLGLAAVAFLRCTEGIKKPARCV